MKRFRVIRGQMILMGLEVMTRFMVTTAMIFSRVAVEMIECGVEVMTINSGVKME